MYDRWRAEGGSEGGGRKTEEGRWSTEDGNGDERQRAWNVEQVTGNGKRETEGDGV